VLGRQTVLAVVEQQPLKLEALAFELRSGVDRFSPEPDTASA